jgi:hypothetical protein
LSRTRTSRFCIICLLAGLISSFTQVAAGFSFSTGNSSKKDPRITSNRPWGNISAYQPGVKYEPPPAPPMQNNPAQNMPYLGAAPGTGWYAAQLPSAGTQATTASGDPVVEVETDGTVFYEQQNVIYSVRVVSHGNLKTLDPVIPKIDGAILEQLDGPVASTRLKGRGGGQEIINAYHFKLTPLRSGEISVPPIRFNGTHVASRQWNGTRGMQAPASGGRFSIAAEAPLRLEILSAEPSVTPWLPLHDLQLRSHLSKNTPAKEGVPVTLTLELKARGAGGEQLPSLENLLKSDDFRAYRDSTTTSSGISRDGKQLTGSRRETYTLIPLHDGWIRLPAVSVAWWDVDSGAARTASLPGADGAALAERNGASSTTATGQDQFSAWFWAPIFITLGLIAGYWLGAFARTRPLLQTTLRRSRAWLSAGKQVAVHSARAVGAKLSPAGPLQKVRLGFALLMPKTVRLWMCTRCVEHEENPRNWCSEFKQRACRHLNISTHTPLPAIAERIIELNPKVEADGVRALAQSLDSAIYGGKPLDFVVWKRDFQQQLRPHLFRRRRPRTRRSKNVLPALNPHSA